MTRSELFQILRPIVLQATGVPECILADPDAPAPNGEYAVIEPFSSINDLGQGGQTQIEVDAVDGNPAFKDLEITVNSQQEAQVSVNFYRGAARDYARKLMQANHLPSVFESLLVNGLGWMRTGAVNNLTTLNQGQQEPRSQIDIFIRLKESAAGTVQQIYTVEWEGENEGGDVMSTGSVSA